MLGLFAFPIEPMLVAGVLGCFIGRYLAAVFPHCQGVKMLHRVANVVALFIERQLLEIGDGVKFSTHFSFPPPVQVAMS